MGNEVSNDISSNYPMVVDNSRLKVCFHDRSLIGNGAFGMVYKGKHYLDKSWSAIKIIGFNSSVRDVLREVNITASLSTHKNIVSYKDCWIEKTDTVDDEELKSKLTTIGHGSLPRYILCVKLELLHGELFNLISQDYSTRELTVVMQA